MASPPDGSSTQKPLSRAACMLCRSRKVRCDRNSSGCLSCQQLGVSCPGYSKPSPHLGHRGQNESVDAIFRTAGIERRKNGACEECRNTKSKCNQARPQCRRCQTKSIPCIYTGTSKIIRNAHRSHSSSLYAEKDDISSSQVTPPSSTAAMSTFEEREAADDFSWLFVTKLPEGRLLRTIVDSYFTHIHPLRTLGFIHKPSFIRSIDNNSVGSQFGEPLLYIICALGARFIETNIPKSHMSSQSSNEIPGAQWGKHARKLVQNICCSPSVQNLMAMVLYCDYGLRIGDNAFVFMLLGCCYRMSRLLRLDTEYSTSLSTSPTDATMKESQRRLLWSCYVLDSFIGSGVESNLCWIQHAPTIPLPCKDSDFANQLSATPIFLEVDKDSDGGIVNEADIRGQVVRIAYIRSQILRYIRTTPDGNIDVPLWVPGSRFLGLLSRLDAWYRSLPQFLTYKDINIYIHRDQGNLGPFYFLHLVYHACIFDLARITLAGYNFPLATALTHAPVEFKARYQGICFNHANSVSQLLRDGLKYGTGSLDDYFTATAAFESTKIQVIFVATLARGDHAVYDQVVENIRTNLNVLTMVHPYPDMPNVYLSALCPFLAQFGFSEIAAQWEPLQNTHPFTSAASSHLTPELGDDRDHTEVVGPMEASYLNQIATFRLARSEVHRSKTIEPQTHETSHQSGLVYHRVGTHAGREDVLSHTATQNIVQSNDIGDLNGSHTAFSVPPDPHQTMQNDSIPHTGSELPLLPLDEAEYLRMADEISGYMTWNGWLEFPLGDYPGV